MNSYVERLKQSGLTEYESKTYYMLLKRSNFTATELSKLAGVPRTRIYEVLNNLIEKGFCSMIPGKVRRFKAVNPEFAFDMLVDTMHSNLELREKLITDLSHSLMPLYHAEKGNNQPLDYIEVIKEQNKITAKVDELESGTLREIVAMNKPPYVKNPRRLIDEGKISPRKGVNYRFLCEVNDTTNPDYLEYLKLWEKQGATVGLVPKLPIKLMIFDRSKIIVHLSNKITTSNAITSMVIEHEDLAEFFYEIFEVYFAKSQSLAQYNL
ncbi:MAG: TrmB family transcriptional regulator [Candidatus Cloacimonetes bacterium]|nr:TrmB family transcriptional regulator [Candidatus Cloacimonadota bacterium]